MEITKEQFDAYREIQMSGVTNMFAVSTVSELSGLSKEECRAIMSNYADLEQKYGEFNPASNR